MRRRALAVVALVALLFAGVATATVLTRKIVLHPGGCVTVAKTRVCAAKAKMRIVRETRVVTHVLTVTTPGQTVTTPPVTVTVTGPAPAPPPTTTAASPVTENFSGTGQNSLPPFTTPVGETLTWTSSWPSGGGIGDPNGDFGLFDQIDYSFSIVSSSGSGSAYLPAGQHQFNVNDESDASWTIHVGP